MCKHAVKKQDTIVLMLIDWQDVNGLIAAFIRRRGKKRESDVSMEIVRG